MTETITTETTTDPIWNDIFLQGDGFYCSYLDLPERLKMYDPELDVSFIRDETALVIENSEDDMIISTGDHREAMKAIGPDLNALKEYITKH